MTTVIPARLHRLARRYTVLFEPRSPAGTGAQLRPAGFFAPAVLARLGVAMTGLGLLLALQHATGSVATAGTAVGVFAITEAAAGPQLARLADRFGQTRVVPIAVAVHAAAVITVVLTAATIPRAAMIVLVALAGAAVPQPGALSATRWAHVLPEELHRTAFSLEATVNDLVFLTGPLIVIAVITVTAPPAGSVSAAGCLLFGCLGLAAHRRSAPPADRRTARARTGASLLKPPFLAILGVNAGLGCFFGAVPLLVTTAAGQAGKPSLAGVVLAGSSAASLIAGLLYGARHRVPRPQVMQLSSVAVLILAVGIGGWRPTLGGSAVMLVVGGLAIAPLVASSSQLVASTVDPPRRTQGFTWVNTASAAGIAAAAAVTGAMIEQHGLSAATLTVLPMLGIALIGAVTSCALGSTADR